MSGGNEDNAKNQEAGKRANVQAEDELAEVSAPTPRRHGDNSREGEDTDNVKVPRV